MRKAMLIMNPSSGRGAMKDVFYQVLAKFTQADFRVTPYITQSAHDISEMIQDAHSYDLIIAAGGDGTVNDVINAMMNEEVQRPLAYIPSGTVNDFAQSLGLSMDPLRATDQIIRSEAKPLDIGCFNGSYFSYVAACGMFTSVSYSTSQDMKNSIGRLAYYLEGMRAFGELGQSFPMELTYNGDSLSGDFIFAAVTNSRSLGGLLQLDAGSLAVDMSDGLLEVLLVRAPKNAADLTKIVHSLRTAESTSSLVETRQAESFHFRFSQPQSWTLDGEYGGRHQDVWVDVVPQKILMHYP